MDGLFAGARRFPGLLGEVFSGPKSAGLNEKENAEAAKQARLQAGLQMLLASRSGPGQPAPGFLQIAAMGAMTGQAAGASARSGMRTQRALQNPALRLSPQEQAVLAALPPEMQQEYLVRKMTASAADPTVVGPGAALVSPEGNPLYTNPAGPEGMRMPSEMGPILASMGVTDPTKATPEQWQSALELYKAMPRGGGVTLNMGESARAQALNTLYQNAVADMAAAEDLIGRLDVIDQLIASGLDSGKLQQLTMGLRQIASDLGMPDPDLPQQELFQGLTQRVALLLRGTSMPGPMSDKDIQFLIDQAPSLSRTERGNALLSQLLRRVAQTKIDMAVEQDRYFSENPEGVGWLAHRARWMRANRIDLSDLVAAAERIVAQEAPF